MRILALDQSTTNTGWSLFDRTENIGGVLTRYGNLAADKSDLIFVRMQQMRHMIVELIKEHDPDALVFEQVQYQSNQKVYSQLSQLQGVVMCAAFDCNVPFYIVEPTVWKSFGGIHGKKRAEQKKNTIIAAKEVYKAVASEDEADAIFIGHWAINNISI